MVGAVRPWGDATGRGRTPVRTCVGCRRRDGQAALLRVVAERAPDQPQGWAVVPDDRRRRPGRGAYVHPDPECVRQAIRRRAFGRALRQEGPVDTGPLEAWIAQHA